MASVVTLRTVATREPAGIGRHGTRHSRGVTRDPRAGAAAKMAADNKTNNYGHTSSFRLPWRHVMPLNSFRTMAIKPLR